MKIVTVAGARPQFIKAAVVSHVLRARHMEIFVHTGQHYDYDMSQKFFEELNIPSPDYNLGISGGSHAGMTGRMMIAIEELLAEEKPDWLLVYGDTNSTLAAALAAAKLHIPICHVEAGCRTHSRTNPEEINRVCTDHISSLLLPCTKISMDELVREGLEGFAGEIVGDPMYDAFAEYSTRLQKADVELTGLNGEKLFLPESYYYLTCHREENTFEDKPLLEIFKAAEQLDAPVIYPVHPRNTKRACRLLDEKGFQNIILTNPVGYLESACMIRNALKIITDSGGLQREAFYAGKKCVTIFDHVMWPETMIDGRNELSKPDTLDILEKLSRPQHVRAEYKPFGDGHAALRIVDELEKYGR